MISTMENIKNEKVFEKLVIMPEELAGLFAEESGFTDDFQRVHSYKCCPTRHGCSGATNCDSAYGNYHR